MFKVGASAVDIAGIECADSRFTVCLQFFLGFGGGGGLCFLEGCLDELKMLRLLGFFGLGFYDPHIAPIYYSSFHFIFHHP